MGTEMHKQRMKDAHLQFQEHIPYQGNQNVWYWGPGMGFFHAPVIIPV
jgi:hypothetical protein